MSWTCCRLVVSSSICFRKPSLFVSVTFRADCCKNTAVCDESMIFGITMRHAIVSYF